MLCCSDCKIQISTRTDRCPLCQKNIADQQVQDLTPTYPDYIPLKKKSSRLIKAAALTAMILSGSSAIVHWAAWQGGLRYALIAAPVLYFWLLDWLTFRKYTPAGFKLLTHAMALSLLLVVINLFAGNPEEIGRLSWSVTYAVPAILVCSILAIDLIVFLRQQKMRDYLFYQLLLCGIGFVPLLLAVSLAAQPLYPSLIAAACSCLTIAGLFIFCRKIILSEFARKCHN